MGAAKIDGTVIAKRIRQSLHAEIQDKKKINPRYIPSLKIIQGVCTIREDHNLSGTLDLLLLTCMTLLKWVIAVTHVSPALSLGQHHESSWLTDDP